MRRQTARPRPDLFQLRPSKSSRLAYRPHLDLALETLAELVGGHVEVVVGLQPEPELGRGAEVASEAESGLGHHPPLAEDDLIDATRADADAQPQAVLAQIQWVEEPLEQHLAGMDRSSLLLAHRTPFQW